MATAFSSATEYDRYKKWLVAHGIDLERVPFDAAIYVKDDRLWYEEFQFDSEGLIRKDHNGTAKRTTKWVFHTVRIEDI